jgi:predicted patatin/cPLA2 family phospholipase
MLAMVIYTVILYGGKDEPNMSYTQPKIAGTPHTHMLPDGVALVLEGGGTRGFYSSGVMEGFMDAGLMFPWIAGVSAGAANAMSYISGQKLRSRCIIENYVGDKRYVSKRNILRHGTLFGYDFIFNQVPNKHVYFDRDVFLANDTRFFVGALDCETGNTHWFAKHEMKLDDGLPELTASCSLPFFAPMVARGNMLLLDGGVSAPIPIDKSIEDGNTFHVVVLTQNAGFEKGAFKQRGILKLWYRKFPAVVRAMLTRHEIYNRQIALCEELERQGKALIIRPQFPLAVGRSTSDTAKLLELHDNGHREGAVAAEKLLKLFG